MGWFPFEGKRWVLAFFAGMAGVIIGGPRAVEVWPQLKPALASSRWPVVEGRITRSGVSWRNAGGKAGCRLRYRADIAYSFEAAELRRESRRISFEEIESCDSGRPAALAALYPVGMPVKVRYAPTNPSEAVLRPGLSWRAWAAQALALAGAGLIMACWAKLRAWQRTQPRPAPRPANP